MPENEPAGTPGTEQDGGTASAAGTPVAAPEGGTGTGLSNEERERLAALERQKDQWLGERSKYEEAQRRLEQYEAERERGAWGQPPPTAYDPAQQATVQAAQALRSLQERDPETAAAILAIGSVTAAEFQRRDAEFQRREAEARFERELQAVPAHRRAEVARLARAERVWPGHIDDRLARQELEKKIGSVEEQARKIQEREEALKRGVVNTTAAPAPPNKHTGEITPDEWVTITREAAQGNREARARVRDYDEGRLKIRSPG